MYVVKMVASSNKKGNRLVIFKVHNSPNSLDAKYLSLYILGNKGYVSCICVNLIGTRLYI